MPETPLRAVLFDLDGTLIDSLKLLVGAAQHAFSCRDAPPPPMEEWIALIGRPLAWQFAQYADTPEDVELLVNAYRAWQLEHHDQLTRCFDGIPGLVERLHAAGIRLAVVTSKGDAIAHRSLAHVGLDPFLDLVIGCDATARHKPDPEPVLLALERLEIAADECAFVGDSPYDVMAANGAGVRAIAVTWGTSTRATLVAVNPARMVNTVAELDAVLTQTGWGLLP
jgi:pyrophosphatase PpaX